MNKDVIRKVYDAMSKEYDMAEDFDTFAQDIQNKDVARRVYDAMYDRYRMEEDFEEFYKDLTFMPSVDGVKTTESGSVVVDKAPKQRRITLADTLNASVPGVVNAEYTEAINEGIEREAPLTQEEKDQRAAMRQSLQADGTIDLMEGMKEDAREAKRKTRREAIKYGLMAAEGVAPQDVDLTSMATEHRQNKLLQEKLDVALDMARAGENQDGLRGVENFGLGLWDSATRLSTWDFGASDIVNNLTLQQIVDKWENDPSSLTATEKKVLEGIGMATAVQELYSDQVGVGYNVGQSLPESAGFMASMALNPASGLGKSLARNAVRTYGRNSIAKNLARIGGDIAETAIMTATTGAGRVAADALERINGSSTYEIGENGVIMYGGQKDQETVGDAVLKAIGSNFIENYSEALGEYFDPLLGMSRKVAAGGLRKMNLNKWADALSDVQPSQMTASIRSLREKTKFGGIFGEIMEEEIGMALNILFVGDNKWSDFADLETQLTTVLSCAIMSGTLNGVEQVSNVAARRKMEKNAKNAEQEASYRFSSDKFAPLREAIDQASPEGMVDVLRDVYMSQEYTVGQKRALAEYAAARLQLQYYNAADAKARRQVNKTQQELLDAQEAGLNAQLPQFFNIARAAQFAEDELLDYDGDFNLVDIIRSSMNRPEEMERILGDLPPREAQLVTNYIYSRARMDGAYQGRSNRAEDYVDDFAYALEPAVVTDAEGNRTITTALLGDRSVYVLENNGDLAHIMRPDGSKTLVKASELTNITTSSAEEVIDRYRDMYTSEYNAETENAFEHHPKTQAPQVRLQLQSPEGEVVITAVNDNMVEIVPAVYKDGQVQPKEGAEPRTITVDDAYAWQDSYYQGLDDAAAATASQPTVDNMSAETTENEGTPTEQIEQSVSEEVADGQNVEIQPTEEVAESVAPASPQTARERVPKDDKGNPIYEQTDADTAWDAIVEETEGNVEMAHSVAGQMLANKKAALEKLQKGKAKAGANVAQIIANEKAHAAAIAQAQNDVAQWEAIVGTEARRREAAMSEADRYAAEMEQKNISEGLKALGEPQSLEEYVLGQLAGGSYKLRWSDKENGTKGFDSHTGLSTEEMKARLSMIDNKNGLTPEEIAHSIVENMDAPFGEVDVMDVTNMVIDAVSTHASRRAMLNGMVESRAELIRQQEIAEQEAKDAWYMEQYHATEEELAAYNEYLAEFAEEIYGEDADYEQRIATFAEIQLEEYDNQGTDAGLRSSADQGEGLASDREGGRSVGETEQLDRREVLADAAGVAEAEDGRAGGSVSAQSDDRQARIDRAVREYWDNVDNSPEAEEVAERDWQRYQENLTEDAAESVETLENGDVRRTNLNSNGEIATVAIERDGNVISVDTYEDGALFEHTDYDANGNATKVTRYKDGEVVSEQEYKDGKRKVTANYFEMAEEAQKNRKSKKKSNDTARRSIQELPAEADRVSGEIFGGDSRGEEESVPARSDGGILEEGDGKKKRTAKARRQSDNRQEARDGKAERLSRGISAVQQQAIDEYTRANPWDANFTEDERGVLNMYRMATLNELDDLAHKLADKINSGKATPRDRMRYDVLAAYAKSGELKAVADAMGVEYGKPVSLDTIKSLFETFNSDADLAKLFDRVFPLVKKINPTIIYRRFTEADIEEGEDVSPDDVLGQYSLQENLIEYNRNQIDSNHCTEQEKASTIVHEMIHAVARYAIRVQEAHNNGVELDIQLPKRLLDAAQSLIEIYDAIKDNEIFNDDRYESGKMYGVSSVHEMLSELADPEFREKLKQVSIENLPSDKRGIVRDALRAIKDFIHRMFGWDSSSAYARTKRALDKLIDNYDSAGYNKARELSDDDFAQQIRLSSEESLRFREKEEPKELIAVHNISEDNLKKVLEAGSLIMPSIAITKADMGHTDFGEISLLFDKSTINPYDRRNKVYGGDTWTPRFPRIGVKLNEKVVSRINKKAYELIEDRRLREIFSLSSEVYPDNIEKVISDYGVQGYYNKEWMKLAYLLDNGKKVKIPTKAKGYGIASEDIVRLAKEKGLSVKEIYEDYNFYKNNPDFVAQVKEARDEARLSSIPEEQRDEMRKRMQSRTLTEAAFDSYIRGALEMENDLAHGGLKEIVDRQALRDLIEKKVKTDNAEYNKWVDNLFEGIVEKRGIRNNRDWYTPSGNLRPWGQLYDPATPANILKYMLAENEQGGSGGFFDSNIMGASAETYESIEEIREKGKKRLKQLPYEEYDEWSNSIADRMAKICDDFLSPSQKNSMGGAIDAKIEITNAVAKDKAAKGIYKHMHREYPNFTMGHAKQVEEIVKEIQEFATGYFEAKPQRLVSVNEVMAAVVPSNASKEIVDALKNNGIEVVTYKKGDEEARKRVVKRVSSSMGIKFREGEGAVSDREVSYENDPIAKFQGKPRYYGKRAAAFAERERRRMENAAKEAAEMLGIEAEIITDASSLQGRKAKAKGWYDIINKKVVVVVPNHVSMGDSVRTVLHEGIAHHGLRELFGDGFDAMLDNIYNNVAPELKARIDAIAERTGVSTSVATEEYLAGLAETTNFEEAQRRGWWAKIKSYFVDMLRKLSIPGLKLKEEITDNELRYLLWRSYKNLVEPNSYLKPLGYAEGVVKQKELKVGEYAEKAPATPMAAEMSKTEESEAEEWAAITMQRIDELEAQAAQLENEIAEMETKRDADDASRHDMWEGLMMPLRMQLEDVYAEIEGLYTLSGEEEVDEEEREAEKQRQLYQKRIDNAYLKAVREGDWEEATDLFRQYVLSKAEDEGIVPMDYGVGYRGGAHSSIAKKVKEENPDAIAEAAYQMSIRIPKGSILVPMPSRTGNATYTVKLAEAIAKATDSEVRDVLKGKARMSVYEAKQKGIKMTPEDLGMYTTEELPKGKNIVIIDNVIDKGTTALAAVSAVKGASVVAYAYTLGDKQRVATLKLAEPVTYDDNKRIIPLSQRFNKETDDIRYRTSEEIEAEYPNWMEGTTTDSGKHSTQVEGTRKTYNKVGDWIEENIGKNVAILDASSGMGYGTADLRERGFNIEDVEPYQSEERKKNNPATYSSYADIDKKYDFIISNAVLNVIPDDWRRDVLHNMAERMNDGGKLFINTRKAGEEKAIKDKIELDTPQEVLVKRNGKIASYQKFFTPQELKAWVESELGDGYIVEVANKKNSGTSGLAAVVVTKKADGLRYRGENLYTPQELAKMETPIYKSKGGFKNLAEAEAWAKENLQGQTRTNQFTGDEISVNRKSVNEMLAPKFSKKVSEDVHMKALQSVLDFIETGIPAEVHKDTHGRDFDVMRLYNAIDIDGKVYRVKSTVRKVKEGDKYYTYEVQKMELIEDTQEALGLLNTNDGGQLNSTNSISGAKLLKGVKKTNSNEEILPPNENLRNSKEIIAEVERESANLGVQVRIARSIEELPDADTRKRAVDGQLKGYFDPRTGEVVLYEPNTDDANDAKRTVLHEIVGHKGLRRLIGEQRYDKAMLQLMYLLPADVRDVVLRRAERHGWNAAIAMDEYLAEQAERDAQPTWWGKVNAKIRAILRNMGFDVKLTDADVTYLLWRSRKKLQGDTAFDMATNAILKQAARKSAEAEAWNEQAFKDAEMRDFESNALPSIRHRMGADTNDYEKVVRTLGFKQAESWQDSMRSLHIFQKAIAKESGKDISDFENAYMYENRMSSANLMEMEQYRHMVYNPLLKEIHELEQMGASRESIINYLFAKSGLERNEVFARRDAKKHAEGDAIKERQLFDKYRQKDYAGLTALTRGDAQIAALVDDHSKKKTEYDRLEQNKKRGVAVSDADLKAAKKEMDDARKAMITAIEAEAQRMVDEFERAHNTDNLWDKIRNCTHTTLNISHDAGVMSDEVYNELWNQFQYYIPLRGFAETTAEDVYLYLGGNDSPYNAPIKTAYGRTSLADDPIATIGNMAESAIVEANRNRLKQRFLYMVERHNTDLASISDVWLEYDEVNDEWHTVFAQIPDDATPSEAKRLQQEFEDRMKLLAEQNPGKYANASQQPNIPYRVVKKGDRQEHHVIVKRNGKDVVITINGNPRVAQAINGLTNPEQNQGMITRITSWINRNLSANFTMRNPAFMVSNFVRDGFYTNSMVWVKENPAYARQYNKNWAICTAQIASLVKRYKRYEKGDTSALDMNNDMDRMFYEFMINGGETGYTVIKSVEDYKGLISGEMKKMEAGAMGTARRVADTIGNVVDTFGRWAEDTSRFAAYMTSRQLGRTITKSIWDAKEISVNFNKKGSGNRMMGKFEQGNRWNYVLSNMSQLGRNLYVFWNAGMQGLNNFSKAAKKSPAKFTAMAGTYFTLGVLIAAAFSGDDDEDDYYNLPEYVRRNNICFKIGKGKYATLPLPIEIRAIYGLGELAYSYLSGREGLTHGEAVTKTIQQMTQVLPIDMMADGGGAMALVPSAAKPVVEVIHNVDWTGRPIYKEETPWNQNDPTWTLAFKSTSPELIEMSRLVNEWTNKNTADGLERPYNRGWADNRYLNNPAAWEHIMEGYLGGMATMFNQTKKTLMMPFNEDLREVRNVPIASRFVKDAGKEGRSYAARNEYYDAKNIMDSWKNEMSKAKKEVLDESLTDEQRLKAAKLRSSLEQQYMEAAERWKILDRKRKALEEAYKSDQSEENRQALDDVMMQMATLVDAYK